MTQGSSLPDPERWERLLDAVLVIGADLLLLHGEQLRRTTQLAVLIHASDTLAAATAGIKGQLPRKAAIVTTAISAGNTALALLATREATG